MLCMCRVWVISVALLSCEPGCSFTWLVVDVEWLGVFLHEWECERVWLCVFVDVCFYVCVFLWLSFHCCVFYKIESGCGSVFS